MEMPLRIINRNIDIVFCIDITGSMGQFLDYFKRSIRDLSYGVENIAKERSFNLERLRFKFIFFRDFNFDEEPLKITKFFRMPERLEEIEEVFSRYEASGGGDLPESGLEALYYAFTSNWTDGPRDRQITMLFTDAEAQLDYDYYDEEEREVPIQVRELEDLEEVYNEGSDKAPMIKDRLKRLAIFAPEDTIYQSLPFDNYYFKTVDTCGGVNEVNLEMILDCIKNLI